MTANISPEQQSNSTSQQVEIVESLDSWNDVSVGVSSYELPSSEDISGEIFVLNPSKVQLSSKIFVVSHRASKACGCSLG